MILHVHVCLVLGHILPPYLPRISDFWNKQKHFLDKCDSTVSRTLCCTLSASSAAHLQHAALLLPLGVGMDKMPHCCWWRHALARAVGGCVQHSRNGEHFFMRVFGTQRPKGMLAPFKRDGGHWAGFPLRGKGLDCAQCTLGPLVKMRMDSCTL